MTAESFCIGRKTGAQNIESLMNKWVQDLLGLKYSEKHDPATSVTVYFAAQQQ